MLSSDAPRGVMVPWSAPPITISRTTPPLKIWKNAASAVVTCGHVPEGVPLTLQCPDGQAVDRIDFASYGTPTGHCAASSGECHGTNCSFVKGGCDAAKSKAVISTACVGNNFCSVVADCHMNLSSSCAPFGGDPCFMVHKSLAAKVHCSPAASVPPLPVVHTVDFGSNLLSKY